MKSIANVKKNYNFIIFQKLLVVSLLIGFMAAFLGIGLKRITEFYEHIFFIKTTVNWIYLIIFPFVGLSVVYFLRVYLFKNKENKGIKEIFESTKSKKKNLPMYKIPSHFINGLLTVAFGGSTGIEVSTVVASATIGSVAQQKANFFRQYKTELICAGVAAGVTALFGSPFAGILFALEVISRKANKVFLFTNVIAVAIAYGLVLVLEEPPLFAITIDNWHWHAVPYFLLLGVFAGLNAVYLTKCVLFIKSLFLKIQVPYTKIVVGSAILSAALLVFPQLYGDGYHAISDILFHAERNAFSVSLMLTLVGILIMKPIVTSVTLASGGDGGVFAPSIFMGAFLGLLLAMLLNTFFDANVLPINFMVIGMAAMLSASIHAPFTALFLVCGLTNDYTLFLPIMMVCLVSKHTSQLVCPYTVYTFSPASK